MSNTADWELLKESPKSKAWIDRNRWPPLKYYKDLAKYKKDSKAWDKKYGNGKDEEAMADDAMLDFAQKDTGMAKSAAMAAGGNNAIAVGGGDQDKCLVM